MITYHSGYVYHNEKSETRYESLKGEYTIRDVYYNESNPNESTIVLDKCRRTTLYEWSYSYNSPKFDKEQYYTEYYKVKPGDLCYQIK